MDARNKIIKAAIEMLEEEKNVEKITVRRLAQMANVGIGLINYHFKSKDNLLKEAVEVKMSEIAGEWHKSFAQADLDPVERLKLMMKEMCGFGTDYYNYLKITASYELLHGSMETPLVLVPFLKEIYGREKDERQLRLIAFQITVTLQALALRPSEFRMYSGYDVFDDKQRNEVIDAFIDNIIKK